MSADRGRKPRGAYKQKSTVFSTRLRAETKAKLEGAAKAHGHSLSQEVEHRLIRSFDEEERITERFGGRKNYAVLRLISALMETVYDLNLSGKTWLDDPVLFDRFVMMVNTVLAELKPPPAVQETSEFEMALGRMKSGQDAALALLAVRDAAPDLPLDIANPAPFIRADLGDVADRIGRQPGRRFVTGTSEDFRRAAEEMRKEEEAELRSGASAPSKESGDEQ
jgi:hypothetical protein